MDKMNNRRQHAVFLGPSGESKYAFGNENPYLMPEVDPLATNNNELMYVNRVVPHGSHNNELPDTGNKINSTTRKLAINNKRPLSNTAIEQLKENPSKRRGSAFKDNSIYILPKTIFNSNPNKKYGNSNTVNNNLGASNAAMMDKTSVADLSDLTEIAKIDLSKTPYGEDANGADNEITDLQLAYGDSNTFNPIDIFFKSMAQTVKQFPQHLITEAKMRVCSLIGELELKAYLHRNSTGEDLTPSKKKSSNITFNNLFYNN